MTTTKIKTADLIGPALDWAVAKAEGRRAEQIKVGGPVHLWRTLGCDPTPYSPTTNWAQGGPIIERERIWLAECSGAWSAKPALNFDMVERPEVWAKTPLIAAMCCFVASKLGDEVEAPDELVNGG